MGDQAEIYRFAMWCAGGIGTAVLAIARWHAVNERERKAADAARLKRAEEEADAAQKKIEDFYKERLTWLENECARLRAEGRRP